MEDVPALTFVEPKNSLGPEHTFRKLIVKKILELAQAKGPITAEGQGGEAFDREVISGFMLVIVAMIMAVPVPMVVPMVMTLPCPWS